jgi:hypothetical protein
MGGGGGSSSSAASLGVEAVLETSEIVPVLENDSFSGEFGRPVFSSTADGSPPRSVASYLAP